MSWCDPGDSLGKCSSLDNEWGHPDDPVTLKRPANVALVAILQLGLWGPGLCSHCYASAKPTCHEHQPTGKGHALPLSKDSPGTRDCACPAHHLCGVPAHSVASISPGLGTNTIRVPLVLNATAASVLLGSARGSLLRADNRASPPGRFPPFYLSHHSLLI